MDITNLPTSKIVQGVSSELISHKPKDGRLVGSTFSKSRVFRVCFDFFIKKLILRRNGCQRTNEIHSF